MLTAYSVTITANTILFASINMDQRTGNEKSYRIDLYSIPVFLIELAVLAGLAYAAFILHFQFKPEPFVSGFYCDDTTYRQHYDSTRWTKKFDRQLDLLTIVSLLAVAPILMVRTLSTS